jgi:hypothetical protein
MNSSGGFLSPENSYNGEIINSMNNNIEESKLDFPVENSEVLNENPSFREGDLIEEAQFEMGNSNFLFQSNRMIENL